MLTASKVSDSRPSNATRNDNLPVDIDRQEARKLASKADDAAVVNNNSGHLDDSSGERTGRQDETDNGSKSSLSFFVDRSESFSKPKIHNLHNFTNSIPCSSAYLGIQSRRAGERRYSDQHLAGSHPKFDAPKVNFNNEISNTNNKPQILFLPPLQSVCRRPFVMAGCGSVHHVNLLRRPVRYRDGKTIEGNDDECGSDKYGISSGDTVDDGRSKGLSPHLGNYYKRSASLGEIRYGQHQAKPLHSYQELNHLEKKSFEENVPQGHPHLHHQRNGSHASISSEISQSSREERKKILGTNSLHHLSDLSNQSNVLSDDGFHNINNSGNDRAAKINTDLQMITRGFEAMNKEDGSSWSTEISEEQSEILHEQVRAFSAPSILPEGE